MRVTLGAFSAAVLVTAWTLARALRGEALPQTPPATIARLETMNRSLMRTPADIQAAVENDLFSEGRRAPSSPYRMPGENRPDEKPAIVPEQPIVLGTAVATDGRHFATVQISGASPTLVHVGDKIGEWIVRSIERGKIVIVTADGARAEVTVPKPGT